jgi:hypothetical protein
MGHQPQVQVYVNNKLEVEIRIKKVMNGIRSGEWRLGDLVCGTLPFPAAPSNDGFPFSPPPRRRWAYLLFKEQRFFAVVSNFIAKRKNVDASQVRLLDGNVAFMLARGKGGRGCVVSSQADLPVLVGNCVHFEASVFFVDNCFFWSTISSLALSWRCIITRDT